MRYEKFYGELGKLLYAVADIDGVISEKEKKEIHELIIGELVPNETHQDHYGTNTAYYAEMEFDFMDEEIGDAETALNSFLDYVEEHHTAIDEQMKSTIIKVAMKLAQSYHGTNKKERELLDTLIRRMNDIEFKP